MKKLIVLIFSMLFSHQAFPGNGGGGVYKEADVFSLANGSGGVHLLGDDSVMVSTDDMAVLLEALKAGEDVFSEQLDMLVTPLKVTEDGTVLAETESGFIVQFIELQEI